MMDAADLPNMSKTTASRATLQTVKTFWWLSFEIVYDSSTVLVVCLLPKADCSTQGRLRAPFLLLFVPSATRHGMDVIMKKTIICLISLLIMSINLSGCNSATTQNSSSNNHIITYEQYIDLLYKIKDDMKFEKTNLELSESQLENQTIVIVDGNMSFGKKQYLSLNNEFEKSTQ